MNETKDEATGASMHVLTTKEFLIQILQFLMLDEPSHLSNVMSVCKLWKDMMTVDIESTRLIFSWKRAYLLCTDEYFVPWVFEKSYPEDAQDAWRLRYKIRKEYVNIEYDREEEYRSDAIRRHFGYEFGDDIQIAVDSSNGVFDSPRKPEPTELGDSLGDITTRLEAVLCGRFFIMGLAGASPMSIASSILESEISEEDVQSWRLEGYGNRVDAALFWTQDGTIYLDRYWKVQSIWECFLHCENGPEPEDLPTHPKWAQIPGEHCANGKPLLDERTFWITSIFFATMGKVGYPVLTKAFHHLHDDVVKRNGVVLFICSSEK
mmetsp:Transcript_21639/g.26207  ORF Transcript_21639/g.26207 Transcript_21639/m.26207 type:complete len:321 (-) Transcript_21639:399-1361(-)